MILQCLAPHFLAPCITNTYIRAHVCFSSKCKENTLSMHFIHFQDIKGMLQSNGPEGPARPQYSTCWWPPHIMSLHRWPRVPVLDNSQGPEQHRAAHWLQKNTDGGWSCKNIIITWLLTLPPFNEVFHSTDSENGSEGGRRNGTKKFVKSFNFLECHFVFQQLPTSCWFGEFTRTPLPAH